MNYSGTRFLSLVFIVLIFSSACSAATVYVRYNSQYNGPGNDWAHAYHTIQAGLNAANSGDEVWVAAWSYYEAITLKDGVALYGGFAGTETSRDQRDWTTRITIIDSVTAGKSNVTSPPGVTPAARIDGFTLEQGRGVLIGSYLYGAGIYCDSSSPTITNNTILGNGCNNGNGVFCCNSSAVITNNAISSFVTSGYGGGIYSESSSLTISNNAILANSGTKGGGIYCKLSSDRICDNTIANNLVAGGIYCENSSPIVRNNNVSQNEKWGVYCSYKLSAPPLIANNLIAGNGLGLRCSSCSSTITNNTIVSNGNYALQLDPGPADPIVCANNIVAFNYSGISEIGTNGTLSFSCNCVYGNTSYDYQGLSPGPTDISADPGFASKEYGNLHLQPGSPCIDSGDNSALQEGWTDIDGQARIQPLGGTVDMGADESDGATWSQGPYAIVRVKPDGNDSSDGSSWTLAKKTLQAGIDAACSKGGEVWVKEGTYPGAVILRSYAYMYGGFNGTETSRAQRNWAANGTFIGSRVTIPVGHHVSAIDGFRIVNACDMYCTAIECTNSSALIANNIISGNGVGIACGGSPTVVNNVVQGNSSAGISGGTEYCRILNNTITANSVHGITGCYGLIANNIVAFNYSGITAYSPCIVQNNCEYGNQMDSFHSGGGNIHVDPRLADKDHGNVHLQPDSPCIGAGDNAVLQADWLDMDCQARIQPAGGTVDIGADESDGREWPEASYTIARVRPSGDDANDGSSWLLAKQSVQAAIDPVASKGGGEVWVSAGVYCTNLNLRSFVHVYGGFAGTETDRSQRNWTTNVTILDGQALVPVVSAHSGYLVSTIDGFTIRNGNGQTMGGGITVMDASIAISHNVITGNSAGVGRAIACKGNSIITDNIIADNLADDGGGIICWGDPIIANNTIADNAGYGIWCSWSAATIANNIVAFNTSGIFQAYGLPTLNSNCVYANGTSNYVNLEPGIGDISADPMFVNATGGDYHLRLNSPCVDVGSDAFVTPGAMDVFGDLRIYGTHVDIGADECDKANMPTFTPDGGEYSSTEDVVIACIAEGATIRYTTDGTDPSEGSPEVSSGSSVPVTHSLTLKARAWKAGWLPSDVKTADYTINTIGNMKQQPNYASVEIAKAVITYLISSSQFYVESDDRAGGILIGKFGHGMSVGMRVDITGTLRTLTSGEKYVYAGTVTQNGTGTIEPLVVSNRAIGNGDWFYDAATGAGQKGVREYRWVKNSDDTWVQELLDAEGLDNIGLLITTFGRVTYNASGYFYIDDGSACRDNSAYTGVKVLGTVPVEAGVDPVGKYVKITGVASCFKGTSPDTSLYRQIRAADVTVIQ